MIHLLAAVALVGWFDPPSQADEQAERERCHKSAVCRAVIDDRPPVLFLALSNAEWCVKHAKIAEQVLRNRGYETRLGGGFVEGIGHVWIEAKVEGKWWAVDNGALPWCDRVCTADEARHGVMQ